MVSHSIPNLLGSDWAFGRRPWKGGSGARLARLWRRVSWHQAQAQAQARKEYGASSGAAPL